MIRARSRALLAFLAICCGCSRTAPVQPATASPEPPLPPLFHADPKTSGSLAGVVRFSGVAPKAPPFDLDQDPVCAKLHERGLLADETVVVNKNKTLANVFVYLKSGLEGKRFETPAAAAVIEQKGCSFGPRVLGVQTGQELRVLNSDPVTHNIHPLAQVNREWNHSQPPEEGPLSRKFLKPELMIRVKCNVHRWMRAWIGVVDHPYYAVTGSSGAFDLDNVPSGNYVLAAWHEKYGWQEQQVHVAAGGKTSVTFQFKGD